MGGEFGGFYGQAWEMGTGYVSYYGVTFICIWIEARRTK
jgi:hypothetical protein